MSRYRVAETPDQRRWGILDLDLFAYCTLPDDPAADCPNLLPVEFRSKEAADDWMQRCYRQWEAGTVPVPEGWRPLPPEASPWS
jgi:hypothetical protein